MKVQVIDEQSKCIETTLAEFKMALSNVAYQLSVRSLLRLSCNSILRDTIVFMVMVQSIPSTSNVSHIQEGYLEKDILLMMRRTWQ